jgi:hypothetical protein
MGTPACLGAARHSIIMLEFRPQKITIARPPVWWVCTARTHCRPPSLKVAQRVTAKEGSHAGTRPGTRGVLPTCIPAPNSPT